MNPATSAKIADLASRQKWENWNDVNLKFVNHKISSRGRCLAHWAVKGKDGLSSGGHKVLRNWFQIVWLLFFRWMRGRTPRHVLMSKTAQNQVRKPSGNFFSLTFLFEETFRRPFQFDFLIWGNPQETFSIWLILFEETYLRDYVTSFPFPRNGEYQVRMNI